MISHAWIHENAERAHSTSVFRTIDNQGEATDRVLMKHGEHVDLTLTLEQAGVVEIEPVDEHAGGDDETS